MTHAIKPALAAAFVAIGLAHAFAALAAPVGEFNDDAIVLLLARALRHGAYALPDGLGLPATYPPPGYPLLLAPVVWLLEPDWGRLRILSLAVSVLFTAAAWRLARVILDEKLAAAATLLVAVNNVFMIYSGAVMPDIAYAAATGAIFASFGKAVRSPRALKWLALAAGLTALLRPHGVICAASLALVLVARREHRRALVFSAIASLPAGLWAGRNYAVSSASSGYAEYWGRMWSSFDAAGQLVHCVRVSATYFGEGLLGLVGVPLPLLLLATAAAMGLLAYGSSKAFKPRTEPAGSALALYLAGVILVHLAWRIEVVRYLMPILPACWIFLLKAASELPGRRRWPAAGLAIAVAAASIRLDAGLLRSGRPEAVWRPATMSWIRAALPASARLLAQREGAVMLLSGREALPMFEGLTKEEWLRAARHYGITHVLLDSSETTLDPDWLSAEPGVKEIYRNDEERTRILRADWL